MILIGQCTSLIKEAAFLFFYYRLINHFPWAILGVSYGSQNNKSIMLGTFFVCYQIAFCSFVATWLCYYSLGSWLIFKDPFKSRHRVHGEGDIQFYNPSSLYCFTLLDEDYVFLFYFYPQLAVLSGRKGTLVSLLH